ncbi:PQQ-dependent sugar dehydrogenase [Schlegelella sp. S2-27]|uniref:PQQ-dependent sugar dehydrogenase n=1 Tax=Caldimonas mangrovi TaxID=2944811 RepID=A0ABT0YIU1_9BURK|nr:PQQ-dependent sugar dehydrogenase [Caldimonas mangrovi]MCM5678642.1 PQQ-dependent sugar dehydrogenase [Caldimonas mangrovi]
MALRHAGRRLLAALACLQVLFIAGCGGGSGGDGNQPPVPVIASPAEGDTFRAGDRIDFSGQANDPEDGALPDSALTWWAELHHDTHTHPFVQETTGGSGGADIPVRGETSDNIWYRFHLRATDSDGRSVTVTRDVQPQKSQITLAAAPAGQGLQLTLDGQPVDAPVTLSGVVGIERDLGAPAEQVANGRRWTFSHWSDGGTRNHTVSTPSANTTYTATYTDAGPAGNQAPSVSLSAPATGTVGMPVSLAATAGDSDGSVASVAFLESSNVLGTDSSAPYSLNWTPTAAGSYTLRARATDDDGATTTSASVAIEIAPAGSNDTQAPSVTLTAPAQLATGLTGSLTVRATASDNVGVARVEFQVDGMAIGAADTAAPYQASLDTAAHARGQHVVRARAHDAAGNVSAWASATVRFDNNTADLPQGFIRTTYAGGLSNATAFAQAPDGRFFVAQQGGQLRVVKNGALLSTPFVQLAVDSSGERGLIGVALHPDFASNGWVYVHYTTTQGGTRNRISRFVANGDVAAGAETVLVNLPDLSSATNHNGGAMHFGSDGKLYVAVGDNADSAHAQDLDHPFGKILRFNDDGSIPSDNPFYGSRSGLARAIWAYGLRNPFTFAVQAGTGRLHINDVGQNTWEEVNVGAPGANYGWPQTEGPTGAGGVTAPLFAYRHSDTSPPGSGAGGFFTGFAIAGGAFYPASGSFPAGYRNSYYFADYASNYVGRLDLANGNAAYMFARVSGNPVDLRVGLDGALYVLTRGSLLRLGVP